jgi:hypothetical protein
VAILIPASRYCLEQIPKGLARSAGTTDGTTNETLGLSDSLLNAGSGATKCVIEVLVSFVACGTSLSCLACAITRWVVHNWVEFVRRDATSSEPKGELCASSLLSHAAPWGVTSAGGFVLAYLPKGDEL